MTTMVLARVVPTAGSPGTLPVREALRVFWGDYDVWREVGDVCALAAPRLQILRRGAVVEVDGAEHPPKCDHCGWPMLRDRTLDEPIRDCDGMWEGYRCVADPRHTHLEPFD